MMTIDDFCAWAGVARRTYYQLQKDGRGPREIRLGPCTIRITHDEANAWARRMSEHEKIEEAQRMIAEGQRIIAEVKQRAEAEEQVQ
jgi:predicted DNA-binding transcriptional regulator AlpA